MAKVLALVGSLRAKSFNRWAVEACESLKPAGMTIEIAAIGDLPLYNDDVWAGGTGDVPAAKRLRDQIAAADALLFAIAEYNFSISGVLKNAFDWASRPPKPPVLGKPYALFGCSPGMLGTARAQYHMRQICLGADMKAVNKPEVFISACATKFDAAGKLIDPVTAKMLTDLLAALQALAAPRV